MNRPDYDAALDALATWMCERIEAGDKISLHMDFHGRQWVCLPRCGLLRTQPVLVLPDRHVQRLRDALNRHGTAPAAVMYAVAVAMGIFLVVWGVRNAPCNAQQIPLASPKRSVTPPAVPDNSHILDRARQALATDAHSARGVTPQLAPHVAPIAAADFPRQPNSIQQVGYSIQEDSSQIAAGEQAVGQRRGNELGLPQPSFQAAGKAGADDLDALLSPPQQNPGPGAQHWPESGASSWLPQPQATPSGNLADPQASPASPLAMPLPAAEDAMSNGPHTQAWPSQTEPSHCWPEGNAGEIFQPTELEHGMEQTHRFRQGRETRAERREQFRAEFLVDQDLKQRMKRLDGNPILFDPAANANPPSRPALEPVTGVTQPMLPGRILQQGQADSQISPRHWGQLGSPEDSRCSECGEANAGCGCASMATAASADSGYSPYPWDPPVYDPATDPDHPKKSFNEVFYYGRKFVNYDLLLFEPRFRQSPAIVRQSGAANQVLEANDFESDFSNRLGLGFESRQGPGGGLEYTEWEQTAILRATAGGADVLSTSIAVPTGAAAINLTSFAAGQTLQVSAASDVQVLDGMLFKQLKFPISTITGQLGVRYADLEHQFQGVVSSGGAPVSQLVSETDFRGFGPRIGVSYQRPVGHTRFQLRGSMFGSILAGDRDHNSLHSNGQSWAFRNSEQIVTATELRLGLVYQYRFSDSSAVQARVGYESQHWFNGGTAQDPFGSFGTTGFSFGVGVDW